jgi:hypothetical protein
MHAPVSPSSSSRETFRRPIPKQKGSTTKSGRQARHFPASHSCQNRRMKPDDPLPSTIAYNTTPYVPDMSLVNLLRRGMGERPARQRRNDDQYAPMANRSRRTQQDHALAPRSASRRSTGWGQGPAPFRPAPPRTEESRRCELATMLGSVLDDLLAEDVDEEEEYQARQQPRSGH